MKNQDNKHRPDATFIQWHKSSYSNPNGNECIEVSSNDNAVGMRDSHNPDSAVLVVDHSEWTNFLNGITAGEFHPTSTDHQHRSPQPVGP
jgi:Domain of unknown function (DUF397)